MRRFGGVAGRCETQSLVAGGWVQHGLTAGTGETLFAVTTSDQPCRLDPCGTHGYSFSKRTRTGRWPSTILSKVYLSRGRTPCAGDKGVEWISGASKHEKETDIEHSNAVSGLGHRSRSASSHSLSPARVSERVTRKGGLSRRTGSTAPATPSRARRPRTRAAAFIFEASRRLLLRLECRGEEREAPMKEFRQGVSRAAAPLDTVT